MVLRYDATSMSNKRNNINWTSSKLNFCASKDTIKIVKKQPTKWDKMYANHVSDKGLIFRIYKEL